MAGKTEPAGGSTQVPAPAAEPSPAVPGLVDYFTEWQVVDSLLLRETVVVNLGRARGCPK